MALIRQCDKCKKQYTNGVVEGEGELTFDTGYLKYKLNLKAVVIDNGVDGRAPTTTSHPDLCLSCLGELFIKEKGTR
jgi:hypothetical protein